MKSWKKGILVYLGVGVLAIAIMISVALNVLKPTNLFEGTWQGTATFSSGQYMEIEVEFDEQSKTYGHMTVKGGWTDESTYPVHYGDGTVALDASVGSGGIGLKRENGQDILSGVMDFKTEELSLSLSLKRVK
jgi:hypothetical protein